MTEINKEYFDNCVFKEKGFISYEDFFASEEGKNHIKKRMKKIMKFKKKGNLLDIGCAFGYYLKEASKNFNVFGIDASEYAIKQAKKNSGLPKTTDCASQCTKTAF